MVMYKIKKSLAYPFILIMLLCLKVVGVLVIRNSKGKRLLTLTSAYAEITSASKKSLDKNDLQKDYDALSSISQQMGLVNKASSVELPLALQRLCSFVLGKNLFWDEALIQNMAKSIQEDGSQSNIDSFVQKLYDKTPTFFKYDSRDRMINDFRKLIGLTIVKKAL